MTPEQFFTVIEHGDLPTATSALEDNLSLAKARNAEGLSPLAVAAYWGQRDLVDLLKQRGGPLDLWDAAIAGDSGAAGTALSADPALVRSESPDGFTALHLAAFFGHPETVGLLIERGAPVDAWTSNTFHNQPLHAAVAGSDPATRLAIARLLLDAGAAPGTQQSDGSTPLMAAAQHGDAALVDLLIAAGTDVAPRDQHGRSAADHARDAGHIALAEKLAPT
jgi:ankyrin repeat protein